MSKFKVVWCRMMHADIAYGGGRFYWCRRCRCSFAVPWLVPEPDDSANQVSSEIVAPSELLAA